MTIRKNILLACSVMFAGSAAAFTYSIVASPDDPFAPCRKNDMVDFAQFGGGFTLTDETGTAVTDSQILDRPTLLYMGYTFCPDVCPLDNMRNAEVVYALEDLGQEARAVFVTVDPDRDTPEVLADFTDVFHPEMIGLTGDQEAIEKMAAAYHATFRFQDREDEFYLIDHTTYTYVIIPGHGVVDLVTRNDTADEVAERMQCIAAQV